MQFRLLTAVTGCTRCPFHPAVCAWMTKLSELLCVYVLQPNFVSLISVHAAPRSTRKVHTPSHGLACKRSVGRIIRHHALNDLELRSLGRANVPAVKEPVGVMRSDGKHPDGLTQIPRQAGKCMTWDVTVTDTLAESYLQATSSSAGGRHGGCGKPETIEVPVAGLHTYFHFVSV